MVFIVIITNFETGIYIIIIMYNRIYNIIILWFYNKKHLRLNHFCHKIVHS